MKGNQSRPPFVFSGEARGQKRITALNIDLQINSGGDTPGYASIDTTGRIGHDNPLNDAAERHEKQHVTKNNT